MLDIVKTLDGALDSEWGHVGWDAEEAAVAGAVWRSAGEAFERALARTTVSDLAERERLLGAGGPTYEI